MGSCTCPWTRQLITAGLIFSYLLSDLSRDSSALLPLVDLTYPDSSPRPGGATLAVELDMGAPGMQRPPDLGICEKLDLRSMHLLTPKI